MTDLEMWDYYVEKRGGFIEALEIDFPELIESNPQLKLAIAQVKNARIIIDSIMKEAQDAD